MPLEAPFSSVKLKDEDFEINLSEDKVPSQKGFIIATDPLTDEPWEDLEPGCLLVMKKGTLIFPMTESESQEQLLHALRFIRTAPQRVSVHEISSIVNISLTEAKPLIQRMLNAGLIQQDRRDTMEPYSPTATYYTVPGKRAEIDKLLARSKEK